MLQRLVYTILRPIMRVLRYRIDRRLSRLPQPTDAPHVHAPGADPDRVLLFGSGPAVGYGVLSNDLALPGHLARQLSAITGRGVDIDLVADPEVTIEDSVARLAELNLWRYDAVLLTIGVNNAFMLTSVRVWREAITALLAHVAQHVPRSTRVLVVAVPPIRTIDARTRGGGWLADHHGVVLNRETRRIAASFPHITFVPFSPLVTADELRFRNAATYQQWASLIVAPLSQQLAEEPRAAGIDGTPDEQARQAALDAVGILGTEPEERYDRIARLACQLFGTDFAAVTFIDHNRHWVKSGINFTRTERSRAGSFGEIAMRTPGAFIVEDATSDARFSGDDLFGLRFYAGYPVESAFGERLGMISVFSHSPRGWGADETELLRDLALQVQRELLA